MNSQQQRQAPWLDRARQQARSLAEMRALHPRPLDWDALRPPRLARRRGRALRPALVWSAALALLLGGGTATWAYYAKYIRKAAAPRATSAPAPAPAARPRPAAAPGRKKQVQPPRPAAVKPAPKPRRARRKPRPARADNSARPAPRASQQPAGQPRQQDIVFGVQEIPGGGELIMVTPPARFKPLWTPEDFRKRGPSGFVDKP